jgi:hypothetical protein
VEDHPQHDVSGGALTGAEEYGGVTAYESEHRGDYYSRYMLRAADGCIYRLTIERVVE